MAGQDYKVVLGALLLIGAYWYFTSGPDAESPRANASVESASQNAVDSYAELAGESSNLMPDTTGIIAAKERVCTDPDIVGASFRALSGGDAAESERLMDPSKCKWATPEMKVRITGRKRLIQLSDSPDDTIDFWEFEAPDGQLYWTSEASFK
ncbi:hypothetical protein [Sinorhizobium meliloti]|uniref:hypothetical protein n=1 Tax=Rhizobium meliloti TaxID=382 RepID=UPI000FD94085|nr:hypothetical protein [Sinorhizobium meliloti]MDW9781830.1 hypothetical protein [Sinorhizobium meliloti]RVM86367.1 hypothetical protein CN122_23420 [Sinorhizobium meliloti]